MALSPEARFRLLVILYLPLLAFSAWYPRHLRQRVTVVEATVNGEPIDNRELYGALKLAAGPAVLNKLFEDKVVVQEGSRDKLTVDPAEFKRQMEETDKKVKDPDILKVLEQEVRARLLLKDIALQAIPEDERRRFYDMFKDDLRQYDVYDIVAGSQDDAATVEKGLKNGQGFDSLAASLSRDTRTRQSSGHVGFRSRRAIQDVFGSQAVAMVEALKPGAVSQAVQMPYGFLILKVAAVHSSYDELKPDIDTIMADAQRLAIVQRLLTEATISSPYLTAAASASASPSTSTSASASAETSLPVLNSTDLPGAASSPK